MKKIFIILTVMLNSALVQSSEASETRTTMQKYQEQLNLAFCNLEDARAQLAQNPHTKDLRRQAQKCEDEIRFLTAQHYKCRQSLSGTKYSIHHPVRTVLPKFSHEDLATELIINEQFGPWLNERLSALNRAQRSSWYVAYQTHPYRNIYPDVAYRAFREHAEFVYILIQFNDLVRLGVIGSPEVVKGRTPLDRSDNTAVCRLNFDNLDETRRPSTTIPAAVPVPAAVPAASTSTERRLDFDSEVD